MSESSTGSYGVGTLKEIIQPILFHRHLCLTYLPSQLPIHWKMPFSLQRNFPRESREFVDHRKDFHSSNGSENETLLGSRTPVEFVPIPEQRKRFPKTCKVSLIVTNIILLLLNTACLLLVMMRGAQWVNRTLSAVGLGRDDHVTMQILSPCMRTPPCLLWIFLLLHLSFSNLGRVINRSGKRRQRKSWSISFVVSPMWWAPETQIECSLAMQAKRRTNCGMT